MTYLKILVAVPKNFSNLVLKPISKFQKFLKLEVKILSQKSCLAVSYLSES